MGILGLTSVEGFSDRLFNSFDTDRDGKVIRVFYIIDFFPRFCLVHGSIKIRQLKE